VTKYPADYNSTAHPQTVAQFNTRKYLEHVSYLKQSMHFNDWIQPFEDLHHRNVQLFF